MDATATAATEDKKKEAAGRTAAALWIATGVYYLTFTEAAAFVSWQAAAFFVGGTFAAAVVFGAASHYLFSIHRDFYLNHARGRPALMLLMGIVSLVLNAFEIATPLLAARWVFLELFSPI